MGYFSNLFNALLGRDVNEPTYLPLSQEERLDAYRWYYQNDAVYERINQVIQGIPGAPVLRGIKSLENPPHQVVEFYAAKLLQEDLEDCIEAPDRLKKLILQIWKWSNWGQRRRVASRWDALYGNLFIKVASSDDGQRVFLQLIDARYITTFETDERDYFTYLRIDTPQQRRDSDGEIQSFLITEVYDKQRATYRVWEHEDGRDTSLEDIAMNGRLVTSMTLTEAPLRNEDGSLTRFTGFNFIPVVHVKFRDIGEALGIASFAHCIEAIDQLNLNLTRLDKMLFPKVHLVLSANATTPEGRPIDAPIVDSSFATQSSDGTGISEIEKGGVRMWRLPGLTTLTSSVPPIDFESHIAAIDGQLLRLERQLPELAYYRLREMSQVTGPAARILLGDILDRVEEARGNFLAGLERANEMALHIAKMLEIEGFADLGDFEEGAFEHSFEEREVFPVTELEDAQTLQQRLLNVQEAMALGLMTREAAAEYLNFDRRDLPPENDTAVEQQAISAPIPERMQQLAQQFGAINGNGNPGNGTPPPPQE